MPVFRWIPGALVCALAGVALVAQAGPLLDKVKADGRLTIAHRDASIPFSYLNADGKPIGYALDICRQMARAIQQSLGLSELPLDFVQVSSANRVETVEKQQALLECGSTTNNASRREKVHFAIPHYIAGARLLVKADSPIESIDSPALLRLVSTKGSTPLNAVGRIARDKGLKLTISEAEGHLQALEKVERGEADAFAMDDVLLYGLAATRPNPDALKVVGRFITIEPLAIMYPKGDEAFGKIINDEMRRLIRSGELQTIYTRWFERPIPPKGAVLNLPPSYLLRDLWKYPSANMP
jgi:glutamate/aspartate transport system substrate-binding protein